MFDAKRERRRQLWRLMLNPNTIYRKTDAGVAEIQARALGLRAELRRLLILVDGVAPVGRLANFVRGAEIDFLIAELETQGLITAATLGQIMRMADPAPAPARPAAAPTPAAVAAVAPPAVVPPAPVAPVVAAVAPPVPSAAYSPLDAPTGIAPRMPSAPPPPVAPAHDGGVEPSAAQLQAVRLAAIRTLHELLGASAGNLTGKIHRSRDAQEMRVAITEIRQNLERQLGSAVGQRFLEAVRGAAESTR